MKILLCMRHTGWLYVLGLCFLLAGCGGGGGSTSSNIMADTSGTPVACAPSTPVPGSSGPLIKIMPLGDSITAGTGSSGLGGYRLGLWNHFIQDHVNAQFVGSACSGPAQLGSRQNEGHPGYRIEAIAANVDHWIADAPSNYVLLLIGTNNRNDGDFTTAGPKKLSALLDQIIKDAPATTVIISCLPPVKTISTDRNVQTYNASVRGIVQAKQKSGQKVYFVDMHSALTTADLSDEVHPNATGYQKMGDAWYKVLEPLLP